MTATETIPQATKRSTRMRHLKILAIARQKDGRAAKKTVTMDRKQQVEIGL